MAAASNLAEALKGKMPQNLKMLSLDEFIRLGNIFYRASAQESTPLNHQDASCWPTKHATISPLSISAQVFLMADHQEPANKSAQFALALVFGTTSKGAATSKGDPDDIAVAQAAL